MEEEKQDEDKKKTMKRRMKEFYICDLDADSQTPPPPAAFPRGCGRRLCSCGRWGRPAPMRPPGSGWSGDSAGGSSLPDAPLSHDTESEQSDLSDHSEQFGCFLPVVVAAVVVVGTVTG